MKKIVAGIIVLAGLGAWRVAGAEKVHVTTQSSMADIKVYQASSAAAADIRVYVTTSASRARGRCAYAAALAN